MDTKLVPAHIHFTKWFIRIRWIAITILIVLSLVVRHLLNISIQEISIYILSVILLALNVLHRIILQRIKKEGSGKVIQKIKREIHFQIITDLILLTLILHYSGGIENPLILFYFFHLIILFLSSDYRKLNIFNTSKLYICCFYTYFGSFISTFGMLFHHYSLFP